MSDHFPDPADPSVDRSTLLRPWQWIRSASELASTVLADEVCWIVDFQQPPSPYFTFAANKFAPRIGVMFGIWNASNGPEDVDVGAKRRGLWVFARTDGSGLQLTVDGAKTDTTLRRLLAQLGLSGKPERVPLLMDSEHTLYTTLKAAVGEMRAQGAAHIEGKWMKAGTPAVEAYRAAARKSELR